MDESTEINRSFEVSGPARLSLHNVEGVIDIAPGDEGVVTVQAVKHPGRGANQTEIEITQSGDGAITVATHFLEDFVARLFQPHQHGPVRVDYTVRLPRACQLEVAFVSGQCQVRGLEGDFVLRAVSGPIHLEDLAGQLKINMVSGEVTAARVRLTSGLDLTTVSGDVSFAGCQLPGVTASTVSGGLRLETPLGAGPYRFKSVSGDVWLAVPPTTRCHVELHSLSGRLRANLPAARHVSQHGQTRVEAGAAGADGDAAEVCFQSLSGDLHLIGPDPGQATSPAPAEADAPPAQAPDDRMAILERISRGELTVDEALGALEE